jgi:hypothetical protein
MVALDLFAAIMAADLPNREQIVLADVLLSCYGPRKADAVDIDAADVERRTGLHRNNVRRALKGLETAGILTWTPAGWVFNKDYDTWTPGGAPIGERLGGGVVRFAHASLERHKVSKRVPIQRDCKPAPQAIQRDCEVASNAIQRDCETSAQAIQRDCPEATPPHPPIRSAHASEDQKREEKKDGGNAPARDEVNATDAEVARVASLCDKLDPYANGGWAQKVHQFAAMYPPAWILAACEAAAAAGKGDWRFVHAILRRYQQQGGPDVAPAGREPLTVARPEPPMPPRHVPEPEMTPEERAEYAKRFRLIVQGAAHAG